ncbi:MAG: hypothetical protein IKX98_01810 [Clostridia bacterium]|nr:hypothetical protein [Clostridia bacterium]
MAKVKLCFIAFLMLIMSLISFDTLAYYTVTSTARNVITFGELPSEVVETTSAGTEFPEEGVYVMPGDIVSKIVSVANKSEHPFYVRVKLIKASDASELSAEECLSITTDTEHWTLMEDGYYYYNTAVPAYGQTEPLFREVEVVGDKITKEQIGTILTVTVKTFVVQSENNADTPFEAVGWPTES